MKDLSDDINTQDRDRMLALYNAAPYPQALAGPVPQNTPLLPHWINAAVAPDGTALGAGCHLLVAGCGSGEEALMLAQLYPQAQVLGVDFSELSIERAKMLPEASKLPNLRFEVADLTTSDWCKEYEVFNFILCHGVADYVLDTAAFMRTLAACLATNGVIYMTANSPHHPAWRIRKAFAKLGISAQDFNDNAEQRSLLRLMAQLMGADAGILGLGDASKAYLNVDIFPAIAHHDSMEVWCQRAAEAGLHFCGSMDAALGLIGLSDEQLSLLYSLGKADLSRWVAELCRYLGMQLLFSKRAPTEPSFSDLEALWRWKPRLADIVGQLPALAGDPAQPLTLTLRFHGLPDFIIHSTAYDLEVLRHCDGHRNLSEIIAAIPLTGDLEKLRACLFRAYHYGVLGG